MTTQLRYDHRHKDHEVPKSTLSSRQFACMAAAVLSSKNIRVLFMNEFMPTPFVSFAVRDYNCVRYTIIIFLNSY